MGGLLATKDVPIERTTPITFAEDEFFDVGLDTRTPLALIEYRYDVPFKFTGKIDKLTFKLEPFTKEQEVKPSLSSPLSVTVNRSTAPTNT
jgi:hypothetical protein